MNEGGTMWILGENSDSRCRIRSQTYRYVRKAGIVRRKLQSTHEIVARELALKGE